MSEQSHHLQDIKEPLPCQELLPNILETSAHAPEEAIVRRSMLFHCTRGIVEIINSGNLCTQSVLQRKNPEYYEALRKESAQEITAPKIIWAPMQEEDANILYFSFDSIGGVNNKGASVLVIPASQLLVNQQVYFRVGHRSGLVHPEFMKQQICVSDTISTYGTFEERRATSNLQIPLQKFQLVVTEDMLEKARQLLLANNYSPEWIQSNLHSYNGNINDVPRSFKIDLEQKYSQNLLFERYSTRSDDYNPILSVRESTNPT